MQSVALGYTSVPAESLGILIMLFKAWLSVRYLVSILQTSDISIVLKTFDFDSEEFLTQFFWHFERNSHLNSW